MDFLFQISSAPIGLQVATIRLTLTELGTLAEGWCRISKKNSHDLSKVYFDSEMKLAEQQQAHTPYNHHLHY
jgi:hypothetical protein